MKLSRGRIISLALGIIAFVSIATLDTSLKHHPELGSRPALAAATTALMAIWWLTEALPMHITALIPILVFPIAGVFGGDFTSGLGATIAPYLDAYIFLFLGGMCIAAAMQQWDLHRRIALYVMKLVGTNPRRLLFGFLCATAFISLWISNTATAAMMLPIGIAVIRQLETHAGGKKLHHYGAAIMLSIAYAANVGGVGTKIGTAPNGILAQFLGTLGVDITFNKFLAVGLPFVILFLPVVWLALWTFARHDALAEEAASGAVERELEQLGPMKPGEKVVAAVFVATALIWIAGSPISGWAKSMFPGVKISTSHIEGGAAMLATLVLLAWPIGQKRRALELAPLKVQPWSCLLLLGGSFAMAEAIQKSGLSVWTGNHLSGLASLPQFLQVFVACVVTVGLSAVCSNTATTSVMLAVLAGAVSPSLVSTTLFAATISASCDFALPAGTPPNAIVFASGYVTIPRMAKTGVVLDMAAAFVASVWCFFIVRFIL